MSKGHILITGATGFVGSRLAERLVLGAGHDVKAIVHRFSGPGLARLSRLPIEIAKANLLDQASLNTAMQGCEVVVHLAYGSAGDEQTKRQVTVCGTENMLKAAVENDVRKFVYFSTSAVYGNDPRKPVVDESTPFEKSKHVYRSSKIEAEKLVWQYHADHGLPAVVLRPPLIYGPYGDYWTTRILTELQAGAILVDGGSGSANLVYIDNLVDAVMLSISTDAGNGQAFNVVDDDGLTWMQVYEKYAERLDSCPAIQSKTAEEIDRMRKGNYPNDFKSWVVSPVTLLYDIIRLSLQSPQIQSKMMQIPWLRFIKNRLPTQTVRELKRNHNGLQQRISPPAPVSPLPLPTTDLVELYASRSRLSNEKIKKVLGYRQRIDFSEALNLIFDWMQYQRLVT